MRIERNRSKRILAITLLVLVLALYIFIPQIFEIAHASTISFTEITHQLTNGNSLTTNFNVLRYQDRVYFSTVAGGYCYLVECYKNGTCRSLQLFVNDYDPAFGEDDYHGTPSIEWIEEGSKILAVGGGHGQYTPMKWAVIDVNSWSIVASGDFGDTPLTYPSLIKTADGNISLFVADESSGTRYVRWYEFDPTTNSWSDNGLITSEESKWVGLIGWNIDTGYAILGVPHPGTYTPLALIQFDPNTKKFYNMSGDELSLPIDNSELPAIAKGAVIIYNNTVYVIWRDDSDRPHIRIYDLDGNLLKDILLPHGSTVYPTASASLTYHKTMMLIAYRNPDNRFELDIFDIETENLVQLYISDSTDMPEYIQFERHRNGALVWHNVIDTTGSRDWNVEASDDHVTHIVFIDVPENTSIFIITEIVYSKYVQRNTVHTIYVRVRNVGDTEGTAKIRLYDHNNNVIATKTVTIASGESAYVEIYSDKALLPVGWYTWSIDVYNLNSSTVDYNKSFEFKVVLPAKSKIVVTNRVSNDLSDYQIKIVLNSSWDGWDYVKNGSDIYFLDENGDPLYYWIASFSEENKYAEIWVKVPSIPVSGSTTIYMYYGGDNPYSSYNDPKKVFLYFEDFSTDPTSNYNYTRTDFYHNLVSMAVINASSSMKLVYDFEITYLISPQTYGVFVMFSLASINDASDMGSSNDYRVGMSTTTYDNDLYHNISLREFVAGKDWTNVKSLNSYELNKWYTVELLVNDTVQILKWYDRESGELIEELKNTTDIPTSSLKYIVILGFNDDVYNLAQYDPDNQYLVNKYVRDGTLHLTLILDNIRVANYVDPEPTVSVGSAETLKSIYVNPGSNAGQPDVSGTIEVTVDESAGAVYITLHPLVGARCYYEDIVRINASQTTTVNISIYTPLDPSDVEYAYMIIKYQNGTLIAKLDVTTYDYVVFNMSTGDIVIIDFDLYVTTTNTVSFEFDIGEVT